MLVIVDGVLIFHTASELAARHGLDGIKVNYDVLKTEINTLLLHVGAVESAKGAEFLIYIASASDAPDAFQRSLQKMGYTVHAHELRSLNVSRPPNFSGKTWASATPLIAQQLGERREDGVVIVSADYQLVGPILLNNRANKRASMAWSRELLPFSDPRWVTMANRGVEILDLSHVWDKVFKMGRVTVENFQ